MQFQSFAFLILAAWSTSCSEARLTGTVSSSPGAATPAPSATDASPAVEASPNAPSTAEVAEGNPEIPAQAITPIAIGGAYLTCDLSTGNQVDCRAEDDKGAPVDFPADRAYIIQGESLQWVSTNFVSVSPGRWTVDGPQDITKSFAIGLTDPSGRFLADWLVQAINPPALQLKDGSFESYNNASMTGFKFVPPESFGDWKAKLPAVGADCSIPVLELQRSRPGAIAYDGDIFIELNSICNDTAVEGPNNVIVYQDVQLKPGYLYQILFSFRTRGILPDPSRAVVRLGGKELMNQKTDSLDWREYRATYIATTLKATLEFEELSTNSGGGGTLIDHVRIYDLGQGPQ